MHGYTAQLYHTCIHTQTRVLAYTHARTHTHTHIHTHTHAHTHMQSLHTAHIHTILYACVHYTCCTRTLMLLRTEFKLLVKKSMFGS